MVWALDRSCRRDLSAGPLWIVAAHTSAVGTCRWTAGFRRPHAFPPLISAIKVERVVVRGRRWLGGIFWEKTRASSHGPKKPAWWSTDTEVLLMGRRWWYALNNEQDRAKLTLKYYTDICGILIITSPGWSPSIGCSLMMSPLLKLSRLLSSVTKLFRATTWPDSCGAGRK